MFSSKVVPKYIFIVSKKSHNKTKTQTEREIERDDAWVGLNNIYNSLIATIYIKSREICVRIADLRELFIY